MKAILTVKRLTGVLALLLAIVMLFAACGSSANDSSSKTDNGEDATSSNADVGDSDDAETPDDSDDSDDPDDSDDSDEPNDSNTASDQVIQGSSKDLFDNKNEATLYSKLPNKKQVVVLMWRQYKKTEKKLINDYQKKTGVTVKTVFTSEEAYPTKLISMVSKKEAPDVVCFSSGNFPGLVTKAIQPLNESTFQLESDCWNYTYMDPYKINGKYFGVAMPGSWSCEDCAYVTYYNPTILRTCGVTTMPYTLYTQGKWNWDEQAKIANQIKNANRGISGLSLQSHDLFMLSAGTDFVSYNGKKFTNLLGSVSAGSLLTKAWQQRATLNASEVTTGFDIKKLGSYGLTSAIAYGLYNESTWFDDLSYQSIQAVPLAGPAGKTAYTPVRPKVWGVAKGAKNPVGAAFFLRYFLDTSNINFSSTFYNKQFETVYNKIISSKTKKQVMVGWGVTNYVNPKTYENICNNLAAAQPGNVNSILNSNKGKVDSGVKMANKALKKIK